MTKTIPERELFDRVQKNVQAGYDAKSTEAEAACSFWLDAWKSVQLIFDQTRMKEVDEFDRRFKWDHYLSNWLQDFEAELWNTGLDNRKLLEERVAFCEDLLKRFYASKLNDLTAENLRRSLGETYFELGQCDKAEELFSGWLKDDPQWGWGWIGWSDSFLFSKDKKNPDNSERILRKGLAIPKVRDYYDILERLSDIYKVQGKHNESEELRKQSENERRLASNFSSPAFEFLQNKTPTIDFAALMRENLNPVLAAPKQKKIGRNDPCPCGSQKTYKKCCLKKVLKRLL